MLPCLAASSSGWQAAGLLANSARYRRWNSFHLAGSWLNQRRRSSLGAASLHQAPIGNASFFIPRGHRRSTRNRAPSSFAAGSYTRLIWIIVICTSNVRAYLVIATNGYVRRQTTPSFNPRRLNRNGPIIQGAKYLAKGQNTRHLRSCLLPLRPPPFRYERNGFL
jgi:hypothetical protein